MLKRPKEIIKNWIESYNNNCYRWVIVLKGANRSMLKDLERSMVIERFYASHCGHVNVIKIYA